MSNKNWFGIESHTTDEYIPWYDRTPKETAKKLRNAYDLITNLGPDYQNALKLLVSAAYASGEDEANCN